MMLACLRYSPPIPSFKASNTQSMEPCGRKYSLRLDWMSVSGLIQSCLIDIILNNSIAILTMFL